MNESRDNHYAGIAWGVLIGSVVAYEVLCHNEEMLSCAVDRGLEHPIGRILIPAAVGATALHLLNLLPERIDVIHQISVVASRARL